MIGSGVADVEADEVGTDIVADVCSYPDQKNMGAQKWRYLWNCLVRIRSDFRIQSFSRGVSLTVGGASTSASASWCHYNAITVSASAF